MRLLILAICCLAATLALNPEAVMADNVYKWVDENGTVHFGSTPPEGVDSKEVALDSTGTGAPRSSPAPASPAPESPEAGLAAEELSPGEQARRERAERRDAIQAERRETELMCRKMRDQLAWAEPRPRVIVQSPDGEVYRMDDGERLALVDEAKSYIADNCD